MDAWGGSTRKQRLPRTWSHLRSQVMRRDAYTCQINGPDCVRVATDVDHIQRGDLHELENLQAACKPCHARKSAREGVQGRARRAALRLRPAERHPGLTGDH